MPFLSAIDVTQCDPQVREIFEEFKAVKGAPFVPNFFRTLGHAPNAARGTWEVYRQLSQHGTVPSVLKEMILVAVSAERACKYCEAAHSAFCKMLGLDDESLAHLSNGLRTLKPKRTAEVIEFAVKAGLNPQGVTAEDYARLRAHGLSDAELMEIVAMAAFSVYANVVADATQMEIDPELRPALAP
ncbi:peroxidase-related enzyme [Horticoccus luteus]|uniref:Peroxidase-related enzyme n=1 Tax=Horticoccus luteus TaxID=2862869 RepID=A0A8F9TUA8_9BACT|nr:peroxidase-related enzyme [Horticoccus luteus]QYM77914.1 peroxidase-related enzyme [Horticoccus luteus]